jgi:hypothetical protein
MISVRHAADTSTVLQFLCKSVPDTKDIHIAEKAVWLYAFNSSSFAPEKAMKVKSTLYPGEPCSKHLQ